jgi:hypothetical protein
VGKATGMKNYTRFLFTLIAITGRAIEYANGGSAVAIEPRHGKMVNSYGKPEAMAIKGATAGARHLYGANVRLLAATNVTGYCAVGVATLGNKAVVATALGRKSKSEAQTIVLQKLAEVGGTTPKIIARWKG